MFIDSLSLKFQKPTIEKITEECKIDTLTHKYMTA